MTSVIQKFKQAIETYGLQIRLGGFLGIFTHANTADRTYTLPDKSDTFAMLGDLDDLNQDKFAYRTTSVVGMNFGTGNNLSSIFYIPANYTTVTAIYKNDWQGNQLQYSTPRTNLLLQSQALATTPWISYSLTTTNGAQTGPDGVASDAATVAVTYATDQNECLVQSFSGLSSSQYTFSLYLKGIGTCTSASFGLLQSGAMIAGTASILSGSGSVSTLSGSPALIGQFGVGNNSQTIWNNAVPPNISSPSFYRNDWQGNLLLSASARTNIMTYSNTFTNAIWAKDVSGGATTPVVTASYATGPDGISGSATRLQCSLNGGSTSTYISQLYGTTPSLTSGNPYIGYIWLKSNTGSNQQIALGINTVASITVTSTWQLFPFSITPGSTGTEIIRVGCRGTYSAGTCDILIAFCMLVAGTYAGSYIATTSSSASITDYTYSSNTFTSAQTPLTSAILTYNGTGIQSGAIEVSGLSTSTWTRVDLTTTGSISGSLSLMLWPDTPTTQTLNDAVILTDLQLEANTLATSFIYTTTVAVTTTDYSLSGVNNTTVTFSAAPLTGAALTFNGTSEVGYIENFDVVDNTVGLGFNNAIQINNQGGIGINNSRGTLINQTNHSFTTGQPVYFTGSSWITAKANAINTLGVGLVSVVDISNFILCQEGILTGLTGLTAGQYYFVSDSVAGTLTSTAPTSSTSYSNPILLALSTTTGLVLPFRPSQVGPSTVFATEYDFLLDNEPMYANLTYLTTIVSGIVTNEAWYITGPTLLKNIAYTYLNGNIYQEVRKIFASDGITIVAQSTIVYSFIGGILNSTTYTRNI